MQVDRMKEDHFKRTRRGRKKEENDSGKCVASLLLTQFSQCVKKTQEETWKGPETLNGRKVKCMGHFGMYENMQSFLLNKKRDVMQAISAATSTTNISSTIATLFRLSLLRHNQADLMLKEGLKNLTRQTPGVEIRLKFPCSCDPSHDKKEFPSSS